jgi:7-cyano-7-deazaguanine synthase
MSKAIVLLSGGLDSTTVLAIAKAHDFECYALSFDYGQKQRSELESAKTIAKQSKVAEHRIMKISLADIGGSALTDDKIDVPKYSESNEIPVTYVPARNTIFLSFALAWAEVIDCQKIYIGVNALDYSGYPDCRPEFIKAFEDMANLATKQSVEGEKIEIRTPLISMTKAEIIQKGLSLGVDFSQTISCYLANSNGEACGECDACVLRINGFNNANIKDPTFYQ